jgi:hypothetical protein
VVFRVKRPFLLLEKFTVDSSKTCRAPLRNSTAGIVRVLQFMSDDFHARQDFIQLFNEMAEAVSKLQQADGLWRASLLDPERFPAQETRAAVPCFAMRLPGVSTTEFSIGKLIFRLLKKHGRGLMAVSTKLEC